MVILNYALSPFNGSYCVVRIGQLSLFIVLNSKCLLWISYLVAEAKHYPVQKILPSESGPSDLGLRKTMFMVSHCILMLYSSPRLYQHKEDDFSVLIFISDKMFSNSMFTSKERKADNWQVLFVFLLICVFLLFENFVQIKN